jgi:hypothetical protein
MSKGLRRAKWLGIWLLQLPIYLLTSYLVRTLMGICYRLATKSGANIQANFLVQHFLWVGFVSGFIAGVIGLQLLLATLLLMPAQTSRGTDFAWKRPQAWTWVLPSCWLAFGMLNWLGNHAHRSVLAVGPSLRTSNAFAVFFGSGCYLSSHSVPYLASCMTQITFTHPWLGTLGYSLAAFVPAGWLVRMRTKFAPPLAEEELAYNDQQAQAAH